MPRDIPIGNGQWLVTIDQNYQIRDVYFPHVGQENHAGGGPSRFGVYTDMAANGNSELRGSDEAVVPRRQLPRERGEATIPKLHQVTLRRPGQSA